MIFNSLDFVYFFVVVTTLFFAIPHKYRWLLLLAASCYFYMYFLLIYIFILLFTIVIDYTAGIFIYQSEGRQRKFWLVCSLTANIGILCFFKYFNFLNDILSQSLGIFHTTNPVPYLSILLPVGLSFHTFQAMSYTIEVYRGHQKPERHFGIYALYVMFYPQLVAGPIERPQNILHQFHEPKTFDYERVVDGLRIMLWGFVKKLVVANRLGLYVDAVYNNHTHHSWMTLWFATFLFIFEIYCDFSGYSDIAIGAAKVMGFQLMTNFRRPFCAKSVQEVWQRWHISLTSWFRDYLYFPLGGSRKGILMTIRNMLIVFAISGLWHGASWTYVVWGLLNGIVIASEQALAPVLYKIQKLLGPFKQIAKYVFTISIFMIMGVFFRAYNIRQAWEIVKTMFSFKGGGGFFKGTPPTSFGYVLFAWALLMVVEFTQEYKPDFSIIRNKNVAIRYTGYIMLLLILLLTGVFNGGQFIYFQF